MYKIHIAKNFSRPGRGVLCGARDYWEVSIDPARLTCKRCLKCKRPAPRRARGGK